MSLPGETVAGNDPPHDEEMAAVLDAAIAALLAGRPLDRGRLLARYPQLVDALAEGITLSKGLSARHWAAAAISRKTRAVAIAVSQSSGTVRIFQNGEVVLRIEPLARPMVWDKFRLEAQDTNGTAGPVTTWSPLGADHTGRDG